MSGGVPLPPPPPPVDPATTIPPDHVVVVDAAEQQTASHVHVDIGAGPGGIAFVERMNHGSGVPEAVVRTVTESEETEQVD